MFEPGDGIDFYVLYSLDTANYYVHNQFIDERNLWYMSSSGIVHPSVSLSNQIKCFNVFHDHQTLAFWNTDDDGSIEKIIKELCNEYEIVEHSDVDTKLWYPGEGDPLRGVRRMTIGEYNKWIDYIIYHNPGENNDGKKK